jgi:hypothetical protein
MRCSLFVVGLAGWISADACSIAQQPAADRPGRVQASDFIPPFAMVVPGSRVGPTAFNDGIRNTYELAGPAGLEEIVGTEMLLVRVNEYRALNELERVSKTRRFTDAVEGTVKSKAKSVGRAVTDPVGTLKGIPQGASRMFGRLGEGAKGQTSNYEDGGVESAVGVSSAKRKLAAQLGVNPYTTNVVLAKKMGEVAWIQASTGAALGIAASVATSGAAGVAVSAVGANQTLQQALVEMTPADIRIASRKRLLELGVGRETAERFLGHPWYSPAHHLVMTSALASLGRGEKAGVFLGLACRARSERDAHFYRRTLDLAAAYHRGVAPVARFVPQGPIACFVDAGGTFVVPYPADYLQWTDEVASRAAALGRAAGDVAAGARAVLTTGRCSARFRAELASRQVALYERYAP